MPQRRHQIMLALCAVASISPGIAIPGLWPSTFIGLTAMVVAWRWPTLGGICILVLTATAYAVGAALSLHFIAILITQAGFVILMGNRHKTTVSLVFVDAALCVVAWVLHCAEESLALGHLTEIATALSWAALAYAAMRRALPNTHPQTLPPLLQPPMRSHFEHQQKYQLHGALLIATACALPMGEGATAVGMVLLVCMLIAQRKHIDFRWRSSNVSRDVTWALLLWLGMGCLAWGLGGHGILRPQELGRFAPLLALFVIAQSVAHLDHRWLSRACMGFCIALTAACIFGMLVYALNLTTSHPLLALLGSFSAQHQNHVPGNIHHAVAGGFYLHRLKMAHILIMGMGILLSRQIFAQLTNARRLVECVGLGIFSVALVLTFARGAMLGGFIGGCLCCILVISRLGPMALKRRVIGAIGGMLLVGAVALAIPQSRNRIASVVTVQASSDRARIWAHAIDVIGDHPFGAGLGNYPSLMGNSYNHTNESQLPRTYPHNIILSALAQGGPIGLWGYMFLWVTLGAACLRTLWSPSLTSVEQKIVASTGIFALSAWWAIGMTHDVLYHKPIAFAFATLGGVILARLGKSTEYNPSP